MADSIIVLEWSLLLRAVCGFLFSHVIQLLPCTCKKDSSDVRVAFEFWKYDLDMISPIKATVDIKWYDIILSVANDLEPTWMDTNVTLWQQPRGLNFRVLPLDSAVTQCPHEWQNTEPITAQLENITNIYSTLRNFLWLPHHHRKHWARLKPLHFGAAFNKKAKKRPGWYATLLTQ